MKRTNVALILALAAPAPAAALPLNTEAQVVLHTAFLRGGGPKPYEDAPLEALIHPETLKLIPRQEGVFSMVSIKCDTMTIKGRLRDCKSEIDPTSAPIKSFVDKVIRDARVDRDYARTHADKLRFLIIQLKVLNSESYPTRGPCWPIVCNIVLPAPVPVPELPSISTNNVAH